MAILNNRYEFDPATDELGRGGFGRVFRAKDTFLNREVVLKYAAKGDLPDKYSLIEEIKRVIDFNHPNLTRYFDAMTDRAESGFGETVEYQIGVMEYVRGGNLQDFLASRPTEEQLRPIILGILEGLDYLHKQGIIHRDIKPKNILLQPEDGKLIPKICDFGISKSAGGEMTALSNVIGTFEYMSPEQLGNNPDQRIGTNADLWSLGVVMYEMFTGELPFGSQRSGQTSAQVIGNILRAETPPKLNQIPQPYRTAISQCLVLDARNRVRYARDLIHLIQHPSTAQAQQPPAEERRQAQTPPQQQSPPRRQPAGKSKRRVATFEKAPPAQQPQQFVKQPPRPPKAKTKSSDTGRVIMWVIIGVGFWIFLMIFLAALGGGY